MLWHGGVSLSSGGSADIVLTFQLRADGPTGSEAESLATCEDKYKKEAEESRKRYIGRRKAEGSGKEADGNS